jgi:hypothetical protein
LEVKVEGGVEASKPTSSSQQAQVILISNPWSWLAHELLSQLFGFLPSNPNLKSLMHVWIMECGDFPFITKVRLRLNVGMISKFPSQYPSHAIFMDCCKIFKKWLKRPLKDGKRVVLKLLLMILIVI